MNPLYDIPGGMIACTPNDNVDINQEYSQGIWLESAGDLSIQYKDGTTHIFSGLQKHTSVLGHIKRVLSAGTTVASGNVYTFKIGIGAST